MTHRIYELTSNSLEYINKDNIIGAMCLTRAAMESISALKYVSKKNPKIRKAICGTKIKYEDSISSGQITPIHTNELQEFQSKIFEKYYVDLCEFIHPYPIGITLYYTCFNFEKSLIFYLAKDLCILALTEALICFKEIEEIIHKGVMDKVEAWKRNICN